MRIGFKNFKLYKWSMFIAILLGSLLIVSCNHQQSERPNVIQEVSTINVNPEKVVLKMELPGRTSAFRVAEVRPQVNGLILKRFFKEGTDVKAGDILYQIDSAPYKAAFNQAKAAVAMVEANLPALRSRVNRFQGLLKIHAVGQQDYDDAVAALNQTEAQLVANKAAFENAKINLSYTPVKAPISGRIGRSNVTEGALVSAYQPISLATVQQMDPIYVDVTQSTVDLLKLKRRLADGRLDHNGTQNKVKLIEEDGNIFPYEGTLQFQDVSVDPTTGSVILRMVVPNPDNLLLPGMFVKAELQEGVKENAILIPQQCISRDSKGNPFAMVVDSNGLVDLKMLNIDRAIGNKWLITDGLSAGDKVIIEGLQKVRKGSKVKATPFLNSKNENNFKSKKSKSGGE